MVQAGVPTALAPTQSPQTSDASDIAALMPTPTPTQLYQTNDTSGTVTMMVQEDILTAQVPQPNDGIAVTMIQEDVPTTQAPIHAPQINDSSDTVHSFKYRSSKDKPVDIICELHRCCDAHADAHTAIPDQQQ